MMCFIEITLDALDKDYYRQGSVTPDVLGKHYYDTSF